jgi:hypothetical protein
MRHKNIFILFLAIFFVNSCTEISPEIGEVTIPSTERVVLLEELTGASCPNCPKGTAAVEAILKKFPGKVAAVGIHGKFLSEPTKKSKYDFRFKEAEELENWLRPWLGKPAATVNRVDLGDPDQKYATVVTGQWESMVVNELKKPHRLSVFLDADYNEANKSIEIDVTAVPLEDLAGSYNITVFITESKIIDAQIDGNVIRDVFEHNHVLRAFTTKFDGDPLATDMKSGEDIKRKYVFTPPVVEGLWVKENLEVVVAVHKSSANDREVIQAAFKKLKG